MRRMRCAISTWARLIVRGGVVAAEDAGEDRVEVVVLGLFVWVEFFDEEPVDLSQPWRCDSAGRPTSRWSATSRRRARSGRSVRCSALNRRASAASSPRSRFADVVSRNARSAFTMTATSMSSWRSAPQTGGR